MLFWAYRSAGSLIAISDYLYVLKWGRQGLEVINDLPSMPELTKWIRLKYSSRSFWIGVPDSKILRRHCNLLRATYVWFSQFLRRWPCVRKQTCAATRRSYYSIFLYLRPEITFMHFNTSPLTSSHITSPTLLLCSTAACSRNVS